jgi:hypothetical protein
MKGLRSWRRAARREVQVGPPEGPPKHRARKNTIAWCRGVPGRQHVWHWVADQRLSRATYDSLPPNSIQACANCRRRSGKCLPENWTRFREGKPLYGPAF